MTADLPRLVDTLLATSPDADAQRVRSAARLISLLETSPDLMDAFARHVDRALGGDSAARRPSARLVLGVTGPPGCGKSSLINRMVVEYRKRRPASRVGVIAVDPSSPFTGGALLGDRVRMMGHTSDPLVFIRSLATRGQLGGLAPGTAGAVAVLELLGCDPVILETVGVGQNEVDIAREADLVMVVHAPGQGDAVQMIKAGLTEIGDILVVNKADLKGADVLCRHLADACWMRSKAHPGPGRLPVYTTSAIDGSGVAALVDVLDLETDGRYQTWRQDRHRTERYGS